MSSKIKYGSIDYIDNSHIKLRVYPDKLLKDSIKTNKTGSRTTKKEGKIENRSLKRTADTIKKLVSFNEDKFKTFITLTFKDDVEDIDEAFKRFQSYIKYCKRHLNDELYYICVPEIQKKRAEKTGKYVIHFHMVSNIELESELIPKREPKQISGEGHSGTKTIYYYDLEGWSHGYSFAIGIEKNTTFNLSLYLVKYLCKDMDDRFFNRQKLLKSNNLKYPESKDICSQEEVDNILQYNKDSIVEVYGSKIGVNGKYINYQDYVIKTR